MLKFNFARFFSQYLGLSLIVKFYFNLSNLINFFLRRLIGKAFSHEIQEKSRENENLFKISDLIERLSPFKFLRTSSASQKGSVRFLAASKQRLADSASLYHLVPLQLPPISGNRGYSHDCFNGVFIIGGKGNSHKERHIPSSSCRYDRAGTEYNQVVKEKEFTVLLAGWLLSRTTTFQQNAKLFWRLSNTLSIAQVL